MSVIMHILQLPPVIMQILRPPVGPAQLIATPPRGHQVREKQLAASRASVGDRAQKGLYQHAIGPVPKLQVTAHIVRPWCGRMSCIRSQRWSQDLHDHEGVVRELHDHEGRWVRGMSGAR
jgi:hypothetical protein